VRRQCAATGKWRHATLAEAEAHIAQLDESGLGHPDYRPYVCQHCADWHIGHSAAALTRRIRSSIHHAPRTARR
jgi:hypothetical protein